MSLLDPRVIAVIRLESRLPATLAHALVEGGITVLELTLTTPGALHSIVELRASLPACAIGAGSVLDATQADKALSAGAQFCVSPAFDGGALALCRERGVPYIPGAFTPSELLQAHRAGAAATKLFPSRVLGPAGLRELLAPMPFLKLVPSGGVSLGNAGEWLAAGAVAVSVGTALLDRADLAPELVAERARRLVAAVQGDSRPQGVR